MSKWWTAAWLLCILIIVLFYTFIFRHTIVLAYQDAAPIWFESLINSFYPRFIVEKHRFDVAFFLHKADQVVIRFSLVNVLVVLFLFNYTQSFAFTQVLNSFWQKQISVRQVNWVSTLFYSGMIGFSYEYYSYLNILARVVVFYKPVLLLKLLHIPFPSSTAILVLYIVLLAACTCVIFRLMPVISSVVAIILFLLFQGWQYSFEKIDHTFATFNYAAMIMPFLLYERNKSLVNKKQHQAGWPLQLICLSIAMAYLMSGLEKILISGVYWMSADSFRNYIFLHQAPLGLWVSESEWLCRILPAGALLFQLGFITILFYPTLKPIFLLMGIAFHIGTYLLFEVGWFVGPWVFVYLFFINWEKISRAIELTFFNQKNSAGQNSSD